MNLQLIDWIIIIGIFGVFVAATLATRQYNKTVSDFLAANRCAGRYMLTMAEGAAGLGVVTIVAAWEVYYKAGFNGLWWDAMLIPMGLILALSGWVTYRYRQTNAMTMAQFFQIRYSRNFRIFSGILAWISGVINFGIAPAVTARCLIYFCGIPVYTTSIGWCEIDLTLAVVMFVMLAMTLTVIFMGGQIALLITDFIQSQVFYIAALMVLVVLLTKIGWVDVIETLKQAPKEQSMLNPFKQQNLEDFNVWYFLMVGFINVYAYRAWQGTQGFNCSAKSPHEARMAGILGGLRWQTINLLFWLCIPICVYVVFNNSKFAGLSHSIQTTLDGIPDHNLQEQMRVSVGLVKLLPVGVLGLVTIAFVGAAISSCSSYLHSWGSIFIQDVVMPFRKMPLDIKQHIKWLRLSIFGVTVFVWIFSMLFPIKEYVMMFFMITATIYLGGAGAVIIGGLYWKRGTTAGAWTGMIVGCLLSVTGIILVNLFWPNILPSIKESYPDIRWLQNLPAKLPFNSMHISFFSAIAASCSYVIASLFSKPDPDFDMDRMLHRGKYALKTDEHHETPGKPNLILKMLGIGKEFTGGDKFIYFFATAFQLFWFIAFVIGTIFYSIYGASDDTWANWWLFRTSLMAIVALITFIWFFWGGTRDSVDLFRTLKTAPKNILDDGSVVGHHNAAECNTPSIEQENEKQQVNRN